jgi:type I restriction-modification system DNA methylase subunit/restriction endonuclease S subunit
MTYGTTPFSPPSGPATGSSNSLHRESNFLAVKRVTMITKEYFPSVLKTLGFEQDLSGVWTKSFDKGKFSLSADCTTERLIYPEELKVNVGTTTNFSVPENFVVFECVHRLFEKGYHPTHIELEKPIKVGHGASGGRLDIWIKDNDGKSLLIIECKSAGKEFESAWRDTLHNGGQLFSYAHALDNKTPFVALYASDWNGTSVIQDYRLVSLKDNEEYLKNLPKETASFKSAATVKDRFLAWAETYQQDFTTRGLFEQDIAAYTIGKTKYSVADLRTVDGSEIQGKYHEFATILRQHNVSGHENAFDKLVNLFLAKIVDENENSEELKFYWKGAAYDDVFSLTDRLQFLYKRGMEEFLKEKVTYIDNNDIEKAFRLFKKDATKRTILDYFRQLKFFTNNDFAFIDVHNEKLFHQNAAVLLKIVRMLQDIRLQTSEQNQFLGDLFEGFLDKGVKQSEGQFFTPTPIVRFLISSLPLETLISESPKPPRVIDYACGAGHFLNEYCHQISPFVREKHFKKQTKHLKVIEQGVFQPYYAAVTGVEKEYRLSKVSKVSASMYGQDDIQIVYADALATHPEIKDGTYSVLVANPPYSVKGFLETLSEADRKRYELFDAAGDLAKNNSIECFFVERAKQLLAPGGVAAIILPSSILSNAGIYTRMREILLKYFDIIAIAEFGSGTFGKTGTNTVTLFLRRKAANPDLAEHYWNRVETWFEGNFLLDIEFEDEHLLTAYCSKIGIALDTYRTLLNGSPSPALLETEMFKEYRKAFDTSTDAKNIHKKKRNNNYTEADRADELQEAWLDFLRAIESDKLYTFMLAKSNPLPVVLMKSPADNKTMKTFLGYEWSSRKGNEGIKYIGASIPSTDDDDDEEAIFINKGISQIKTPLFNPGDLYDPAKVNSIIRAAFNGEMITIPDVLAPLISCTHLTDLLDFSRVTFDKAFKTTQTVKTEIVSQYPLVKLGDLAEYSSNTVFASELTPQTYVGVDNLLQNLSGKTDSGFVPKNGSVTQYVLGDILLSNIRPYLKKIWFADNIGGASNDVLVLRVTDSAFDALFVYYCLGQDKFFDYVMGAVKGVKMPRGDKNHILCFPIPKPDPATQSKIVEECKDVDAGCVSSLKHIETAYLKIEKVFEKGDSKRVLPFRLSNKDDFDLVIGKRVVENELEPDGKIPIYSANVFEPLGHFNKLLLKDFSTPSVLWGIDGDWMVNLLSANQPFYPTDHCGVLRVKTDKVNPRYLAYALKKEGEKQRFSRTLRASTDRIRYLTLTLPSPEEQNRIVAEVEEYEAEIAAARAVLAAAPARKQAILEKWL